MSTDGRSHRHIMVTSSETQDSSNKQGSNQLSSCQQTSRSLETTSHKTNKSKHLNVFHICMHHMFPTVTFLATKIIYVKEANGFKLNLCLHPWTSSDQFWLSEIQNPQQNTRLTALMVWIQLLCRDGGITATRGGCPARRHCERRETTACS